MFHKLVRRRYLALRAGLRKGIAVFALAGYLAASVGFPAPNFGKSDAAGVYPCAGRGCGCRSAEECWRGCCCHTVAQRLAWAKAHGITPPSYVGQKLEEADDGPIAEQASAGDRPCCCGSHKRSDCPRCARRQACAACEKAAAQPTDEQLQLPGRHCCDAEALAGSQGDDPRSRPESEDPAAEQGPRVVWLMGLAWFKCRGIGSHWLALGDSVAPPPPAVGYARDDRVVGTIAERALAFPSPADVPPTPPG
jgi:hypothetical protein